MPETSQPVLVSKKNPPPLNIIDNNSIYVTSNQLKSIIDTDNPNEPPSTPQAFCLRWNNYQSNLTTVFTQLLQDEQFVDVTLSCDGYAIKAHKIVLSACSPYFQSIFYDNPCQHPIVIMRDIRWTELQPIVEFMYRGEINVSQDQIEPLLKVAQLLKVRGLADVNNATTTVDGGIPVPVEQDETKKSISSMNSYNNYVAGDDMLDEKTTLIKDEIIEGEIKTTIKRSRNGDKEWNENVYDLLATAASSTLPDKRHKWSPSSVKNEHHVIQRNDTFTDSGVQSVPPSDSVDISDGGGSDSRMKDVIDSVAAGDLIIDEDKVSRHFYILIKI